MKELLPGDGDDSEGPGGEGGTVREGEPASGALPASCLHHWVCGFVVEASLQGGLGRAGQSADPRLFYSKRFWPLRRVRASDQGARSPLDFQLGFVAQLRTHAHRPELAGPPGPDRGLGLETVRALEVWGAWLQGCIAHARLVEGWPLVLSVISLLLIPTVASVCSLTLTVPRFGSRIAEPNGESGSATSRPSCARMASGRSSTGLCSPTTTCTRAIPTITGRPKASRQPPCPRRASPSSTQ